MRKILYTVSTGPNAQFQPSTRSAPAGWDFASLTDKDCPAYLSPKQKAAWAKINGPRIFSQYEASLCVDDDMTVVADPSALFGDVPFAALQHASVKTLDDDFRVIATVRKACAPELVARERARYTGAGIANPPLWLSGLVYRVHTHDVLLLTGAWNYWYGLSETQRDQPSLCVAIAKTGLVPLGLRLRDIRDVIKHDEKKSDREGTRQRLPNKNVVRRG